MRNVDPTLPRDGTDLIATESRLPNMDPTLPRDGTDLIATESRLPNMDPTLPRDGTDDLITLRVVMRSALRKRESALQKTRRFAKNNEAP